MKLKQIAARVIEAYMTRTGMVLNALAPEVEKLDAVPEHQRSWYEPDTAKPGTFKLNLSKVEVEDVGGLKTALERERTANRMAKSAQEAAVREALKAYDGIDPEKTRALMSKFANEEEAALIAAGKVDEVIAKRMDKQRTELLRQVEEAKTRESGALEVASTFMERVLDNHVRAAAAKAGLHASAVEDALLRARRVFSLNDDGEAVQLDEHEEPVLGKDGKSLFNLGDWIEERRVDCPHWFPAGGSGGGAGGSGNGRPAGANLSGLSPTARLTAARAAGAGAKR